MRKLFSKMDIPLLLLTIFFIVVGLVIGVCFEFIMNSLDKTIKDRKYIEDTFKVKVIGLIPDLLDSKDKKTY